MTIGEEDKGKAGRSSPQNALYQSEAGRTSNTEDGQLS